MLNCHHPEMTNAGILGIQLAKRVLKYYARLLVFGVGELMHPIITIEFKGKSSAHDFAEESVAIHSPEELFAFVAPGGGCETIPNEVDEIQIVFLPPAHRNSTNPIADRPATLELGMVYLTGPLAEIGQAVEMLLDKAGRGELSASFLQVTGINT
jgi:hypothetical protein